MNQADLARLVGPPELEKVPLSTLLVEELGLDSIALIEIVVVLEDFTGADAAPELIESTRSAGDLLAWFR